MFLDEIRGKTRSQWMLSTLISTDVAPPPISIDLVDVQPPKSLGSLWRSESC